MDVLNSDVLEKILSYLDMKSLCNYSLASTKCFNRSMECGRWKLMMSPGKINDEWRPIAFGRKYSEISVEGSIKRAIFEELLKHNRATLRNLSLRNMLLDPETLFSLSSQSLFSLSIMNSACSPVLPEEMIKSLKFPTLKKLTVVSSKNNNSSNKMVANYFVGAENLQQVSIEATDVASCENLLRSAKKLRNLSITIWNGRNIMSLTTPSILETVSLIGVDVKNVVQLLNNQKCLEKLRIFDCGIYELATNDPLLPELIELLALESLRKLDVEISRQKGSNMFKGRNCNLKSLRLTRCFLDNEDIKSLALMFPNLEKLEILGNMTSDCRGFSLFTNLRQVRLVHVLQWFNYEEDITRIKEELPDVEIL